MPLQPVTTVPHVMAGEVPGSDGGTLLVAMADGADTANLCTQNSARSCMACVALDQAGWVALRELADEMVRRLGLDTQPGVEVAQSKGNSP